MVNDTLPSQEPAPTPDRPDRIGLVLAILLLGWISTTSLLLHGALWTVEQFFIVDDLAWPIWLWPAAELIHALLLLVPLLPLAVFWRAARHRAARYRAARYRAVFQTWTLAAVFILFLAPARLAPVNAASLAAVLQIVGSLLYLAFIFSILWLRRRRDPAQGWIRPRGSLLPALLLAPLLIWSWIAWGALGSWLDILLNLLAALLLGLSAGVVIGHFLLDPLRRTGSGSGWDITLGGFVAGAGLMIMGSAFGFNGLQLFLMLLLPVLGRTLLVLSHLGRERPETGWLTLALFIGLIAAGPMLLVDPDELLLVLNLGSRDVFQWSVYATLVTMLGTWTLGLLLSLTRRWLARLYHRGVLIGGVVAVWGGAILLYGLVGQPGLHGERLFVILNDQADLSSAASIEGYDQRRQYVYQTLVSHADATQADLRAILDRVGVDYTSYYLTNGLEVNGGPLLRLWLSSRPEVDRVLLSPVLRPLPAPIPPAEGYSSAPTDVPWNITTIGADRVWEELGVTGEGIVVGQSDSGAQWNHPELQQTYRGRDGQHDYNWFDPWNHTTAPTDIGGHGTHTIATSVGRSVGVAPGATWYGCVNLARNLANPALYLDCMQFMLAPFPLGGDPFTDGDPTRGAHVINNSWGCPDIEGCDPNALVDGVRALRTAGVFVVASAGNTGEKCESVTDPLALYDDSFSVGAVDSGGKIAYFSSRGPVTVDGSGRTKPDILAPGVDVLSAYPNGTYYYASGTSMAGPHLVGVVALIWSANPALIGDIAQTEQILIDTARPYDYERYGYPSCAGDGTYPNNAVGYGIVDAYAAVQRALEITP